MRVLITFRAQAGIDEAIVTAAGGTVVHTFSLLPIVSADVPKAALEQLRANPAVKAVEPDYPDACRIDLWAEAHEPHFQPLGTAPWGVSKILAPEVHAKGITGADVKVAVIDTGVDYKHPDLAAVYAGGFDFVNNDPDPMDDHKHGTHVAGSLCAALDGQGIYGVAPKVKLYALKVLSASGSGSWENVIKAYEWCVQNKIQVCSNSYGGSVGSVALQTALKAMVDAGVIGVFSAGNSGAAGVGYPGRYPEAIAVGATDDRDVIAGFSSRGPEVFVSAPGVAINSCVLGGAYALLSGTSMACPHVAGQVALALSAGIPPTEIRNRLAAYSVDLGASGRDPDYGFGRVNALAFIDGTPPPPPPPPPGPSVLPLVDFDASESTDPDGTIAKFDWSFGDGQVGTGKQIRHKYATLGWKTAVLSVTDDKGATDSEAREVNIVPNRLPQLQLILVYDPASKVVPCKVTFDASRSTDPDGKIVAYDWDFGSGETATGSVVSKIYSVAGTYTAKVALKDDQDDVNTYSIVFQLVTNQPPVASATVQPLSGAAPLTVQCDGSASKDPDGGSVMHDWSFAGLGTAKGPKASFAFSTPGDYEIVLTVTDSGGLKGQTSVKVTVIVSDPTNQPPLAKFKISGK